MAKDRFTVRNTHEYGGDTEFDAVKGQERDFINLRVASRKAKWSLSLLDNDYPHNHTFHVNDVKRIIRGLTRLVKMQESR